VRRWLRTLALYAPALAVLVAGVAVLLATLVVSCEYVSCPVQVNGTSVCPCATSYTADPVSGLLLVAAGVYSVGASAFWFARGPL
jgi:hypothetical protein